MPSAFEWCEREEAVTRKIEERNRGEGRRKRDKEGD
jgi:hypothetical protein